MSKDTKLLPYGKILSPENLGGAVRAKRKADGLTQAKAAALCGVGVRFLSDLENGKSTVELGKVLNVLAGLGLTVDVRPKGILIQKNKQQQSRDSMIAEHSQKHKIFLDTSAKLLDFYEKNSAAKLFSDISKQRKDYFSLGMPMDKYNDIASSYKQIMNLNNTAVSSLGNALAEIENLGASKFRVNNALRNSVNMSIDALKNLDRTQLTIKNLGLNTEYIDNLKENYKKSLKLSKDTMQKISDLDKNIGTFYRKKKK